MGECSSTLSGKERGRKGEQKERGREAGIENGWSMIGMLRVGGLSSHAKGKAVNSKK